MAKRLSAAARRSQIIDVASRLFAFRGLHGTTTKEIARAAGISEPVLYQHFKSKEEIYEALELMCQSQTTYFHQLIKDRGTGLDVFVSITYLLVRIISFSKEPGQTTDARTATPAEILLRLMGQSFLEDGRFARKLVQDCIGSFFEQWGQSFKTVRDQGHLQTDKADEVTLWLAYQSLIGFGLFVLPKGRLVDGIKDSESGSKVAVLFLLRGLGLKERSLQKSVKWPELRKSFEAALAASKKFQDAL